MEIFNMRRSLFATIILMFLMQGMAQKKDLSLIEATCRNTKDYELCISTLLANPRSITANGIGLPLIMVEAVKAKAKETIYTIDKLKASRPELRDALNECTIQYHVITKFDVPMAVEYLNKWLPLYAKDAMADSSLQVSLCNRNFDYQIPPLTGLNDAVYNLCNVAEDVIGTFVQ